MDYEKLNNEVFDLLNKKYFGGEKLITLISYDDFMVLFCDIEEVYEWVNNLDGSGIVDCVKYTHYTDDTTREKIFIFCN
jgi:hypothetical protein